LIPPPAHAVGRLDGRTILRYAHAYESGGGLEQYLADLNLALCQRSRLTIVQMQMTTDRMRLAETEETIGGSRIVKVPLWVPPESKHASINARPPGALARFKTALRNRLVFTPAVYHAVAKRVLQNWPVPRRSGEPAAAGAKFKELLTRFPVDLVAVHSCGGSDASEMLTAASRARLPAVIIHHFANDRFKSFALCRQAMQARAVGGVCGVAVPAYLRERFTNLADGIDVDFFRRENARPVSPAFADPILFLPARITPTKGQLDLIRAGGKLLQEGVRFQIVFAGRVDSEAHLADLKKAITTAGLTERVYFTGQLDAAGLRDWYAAAAILAFPTHHHEGLPRILLEAQAMALPVVVHEIGGTADGVKSGETGFLIPENDPAQLVQRLRELLQNPAQREQFGQAGRRWIESRFSLTCLAERHELFYCQVSNL